ncbi:hypothetical protein JRO89_XS04G0098000 [Xanthoceras sorbifolium]|uniref:RNA polymerase sigma-70 domain-containing protein n=1 Tax=Xanthoceras sorbifolium TaxID=99658 RepID=A0ABQ8I5G7_9ROSI|nr:hypothetical protein JRO89_XS04G0098000 [Xanthoceras sorbifolium]
MRSACESLILRRCSSANQTPSLSISELPTTTTSSSVMPFHLITNYYCICTITRMGINASFDLEEELSLSCFIITFQSAVIVLLSKNKEPLCFRTHCILSTTSPSTSTATAAVLDVEKLRLPSLEDHSNSVAANRPWTYIGAVGPAETMLMLEDPCKCDICSAYQHMKFLQIFDACTIALAKAAAKVAKDAALLVNNDNSVKLNTDTRRTGASAGRDFPEQVDYSDQLHYLRATTNTSRLLTATEETVRIRKAANKKIVLDSLKFEELLKLERLQEELAERCGGQPTFAQWAAAAGVDQKELRRRLNYGILCKDKMIKSNVRLVISIARNYQGAGMNLPDLVQEGCRGLVRGAEKFDASKGFKFSTYAHWWIKQSIRKSLTDRSRTIRLPVSFKLMIYLVKEARKQLYSENGRQPDNEELAAATGLPMKRLQAVLLAPKAPRSLDQKFGIYDNVKPSEVIADPEAETSEDLLIKKFMKQDLEKVLDTLNPKEKQVVRWRFGLEDGRMKTLQEIGEMMGVSRERIRQIESCAFRKLKNKKRTKLLQQYLVAKN